MDIEEQVNSISQIELLPIVQKALNNPTLTALTWANQPLAVNSAVGYLFRLSGTARRQSEVQDWSIILKIIPSPTNKQVKVKLLSDEPSHFGYWKREMLFYESSLREELPDGLTTPHCYQVSDYGDTYWLWLEDIADATPWSLATFGQAARQFGYLNGLYAVERPIPSWGWLATDEGVARMCIDQRFVTDESWRQISDLSQQYPFIRQAWPDDVLEGMERLWGEREDFFTLLRHLPKTLVHGDVARKNLFVRPRREGVDEIVAIDWGLLGRAPLGQEISGLTVHTIVGQFLPPGELEELDNWVFHEYLHGLHEVGWRGDSRIVRLGYTARTALHFSILHTVLKHETKLTDTEEGREFEARTALSRDEYLHMLVTVRRFVLALANETRTLKSALHL